MYIAKNVDTGRNREGGIIAKNVDGINLEGGKILKKKRINMDQRLLEKRK